MVSQNSKVDLFANSLFFLLIIIRCGLLTEIRWPVIIIIIIIIIDLYAKVHKKYYDINSDIIIYIQKRKKLLSSVIVM